MAGEIGGDVGYLRVLGPLAYLAPDGADVEFSPVQRRLIARLVVGAPRSVHRNEIEQAIWQGELPASSRQAIHNQVSRIRALVGEDSIATTAEGYRLRIDTDLSRLQRAVIDAEVCLSATGHDRQAISSMGRQSGFETAADVFETLHELFEAADNDILGDLHHDEHLEQFRHSANAVVAAARHLRLEAALQLGLRDWAVIEGGRMVAEEPLDERAAANYARALAQAGRRSDALAALARIRRDLRLHFGVESGDLLDTAESAILHAGSHARPPADRGAPPTLVGRGDEVRQILQSVARRHPVRVRGEHGAGVTRILFEVRARLMALGVRVVLARAEEHPHSATSLIEELLFEIGVTRDPTQSAISAFTAVARSIDEDCPTVFMVDDVQFLGPSAWQALRAVVDADYGGLILGGHGHVLELTGEVEVHLGPLDAASIATLVQHWAPGEAPDTMEIYRASGGNPLAVRILTQAGARDEASAAGADANTRVVSGFLERLVGDLDVDRRHDLQLAAVAGDGFPMAALDRVTWAHPLEFPSALVHGDDDGSLRFRHGAVQAHVYGTLPRGVLLDMHYALGVAAREINAPAGTVARHLLAAAELDPSAAIAAAREAAREAVLLGAHADAADWLRRAREIVDGRPYDEPFPSVDQAKMRESTRGRDNAAGAPGALGIRDSRADVPLVPTVARDTDDELSIALAVEHADAMRLAGDARHLDALIDATERALRFNGDALVAAAGFALLQLGASSPAGEPDARVTALIDRVIATIADPQQRAPVQAAASLAWSMTGHADTARDLFDRAEAAAIDPAVRLAVLPFAYLAMGRPVDLQRRTAIADELMTLARAADEPAAMWEGLHLEFSVAIQRADGPRLHALLAEMEQLIDRVGDVGRRWSMLYCAATLAEIDGDLTQSESLAVQAHRIFAPVSAERADAALYGQLLQLRMRQGRLVEVRGLIEQLVSAQPGVTAWHAAAALVLAHAALDGERTDGGDRATADARAAGDEARQPADEGAQLRDGSDVIRSKARAHAERALDLVQDDFLWLAAHVVGGRAAAILGDADLVAAYAARLEPWADFVCWQGTCSYGPVADVLAELASARGLADDSSAYRARAAALQESLRSR